MVREKNDSRFRAQGEIEEMFDTVAKGITVSHRAHFPTEQKRLLFFQSLPRSLKPNS